MDYGQLGPKSFGRLLGVNNGVKKSEIQMVSGFTYGSPGRPSVVGFGMAKRIRKRLIMVGLVAAAVAALSRVLRSGGAAEQAESRAVPGIGGDTWPPVPVNPERRP